MKTVLKVSLLFIMGLILMASVHGEDAEAEVPIEGDTPVDTDPVEGTGDEEAAEAELPEGDSSVEEVAEEDEEGAAPVEDNTEPSGSEEPASDDTETE